jgi:hypothetical protein
VEIETPEGSVVRLVLEERPLEVGSVALAFPGRVETFPLRRPGGDAKPRGLLLPMAAGAALALAGVALAAGARRARARRARAPAPDPPGEAPPAWRAALAELEGAAALAAASPERAADAAALALRRLLARRFAVAASLTPPELRELRPPLGLERHWDVSVGILEQLDELRFRPPGGDATARAARAREASERARAWIGDAVPEARVR